MSALQWSLLVIGAVVIGAVYLYNWLQERNLQRRLQQAFGNGHDDVLLKAGVESSLCRGRIPSPPRLRRRDQPPHADRRCTDRRTVEQDRVLRQACPHDGIRAAQ